MWDISPGQGAAMGAGASVAGGVAGAIASARQAAKQRDFVKWQMRNKYQLQMADMRDAGLNPILAAGQSPGMPGSAAATNIGNPAQGAATAAREAMLMKKQGALLDAQRNAANNSAAKSLMDAIRTQYNIPEAAARGQFFNSAPGRIMVSGKLGSENMPVWYRPGSYLGYTVGAGYGTAKELQSYVGGSKGWRQDGEHIWNSNEQGAIDWMEGIANILGRFGMRP